MALCFFQAEDGIRDGRVTGVQTCALPICRPRSPGRGLRAAGGQSARRRRGDLGGDPWKIGRSEERRVGKEGRARGAPGPSTEKGPRGGTGGNRGSGRGAWRGREERWGGGG